MAKKGALKSTLIVTSDELKVNGGRWLLQSGPAIRVRGFNSDSIGDRKIIGGDALPIYVLAESDARVNGGQFLLKGGQPIQVTDVIGSARGVIQGKAIPVWPVDDDGNFDSDFAGAFTPDQLPNLLLWLAADLGLSLSDNDPVVTWPDQSGNGNDAAQAIAGERALFKIGILNGQPVLRFDGANDNYDLSSDVILAADLSIFIVFTIVIGDVPLGRFAGGTDYLNPFAANMWNTVNPTDNVTYAMAFTSGNFALQSTIRTGGIIAVHKDGVQTDSNPHAGTFTFNTIAQRGNGTLFLLGDMAEMIIYNDAKAGDDLSNIETYLNDKYAIL